MIPANGTNGVHHHGSSGPEEEGGGEDQAEDSLHLPTRVDSSTFTRPMKKIMAKKINRQPLRLPAKKEEDANGRGMFEAEGNDGGDNPAVVRSSLRNGGLTDDGEDDDDDDDEYNAEDTFNNNSTRQINQALFDLSFSSHFPICA